MPEWLFDIRMPSWLVGLLSALIGALALVVGQILGPWWLDHVKRVRDRKDEGRQERRAAIRRLQAIPNALWLLHTIGPKEDRQKRHTELITDLFDATASVRLGVGVERDQAFVGAVRDVYRLMNGGLKDGNRWRALARALEYLDSVIDDPETAERAVADMDLSMKKYTEKYPASFDEEPEG